MIARLNPQPSSVRNKRSSTEIPHNFTNVSGLSARMIHSSTIDFADWNTGSVLRQQVEYPFDRQG
jgi:hypothetical protein